MGWIEQKHGWLPYWDDRYRKPVDHLPYWDDRVIDEYGQDEAQRHSPFILEGDHYEEAEEPSIFEQAERIMREDETRWARRTRPQSAFAWAMPPADDKVTFVDEPVLGDGRLTVDDQWEYFDPEDPEFTPKVAARLMQFEKDGLIDLRRLDELLDGAYEAGRIPSRRRLAEERLRMMLQQGIIDRGQFSTLMREIDKPGFKIHKNPLYYEKILKYCKMLEEIRDFMDGWVRKGMPAQRGGLLERYLIARGRDDAIATAKDKIYRVPEGMTKQEWKEYRQLVESPSFGVGRKVTEEELQDIYVTQSRYDRLSKEKRPLKRKLEYHVGLNEPRRVESDLEKGKRIVAAAWMTYRDVVEQAIKIARQPGFVHLDNIAEPNPLKLRFEGRVGENVPLRRGYTLDLTHVKEEFPHIVMGTMIHEPLHDYGKLWLYHSAQGNWKQVDESIGWNVGGNWQEGIGRLMGDVSNIMRLTPLLAGKEATRLSNRWRAALTKCGIQRE